MILSAARLHDDRSDGGGGQRSLDLTLGVRPWGLSGKLALVAGTGPPEELGAGVGGCAAGPLKATGCAKPDREADMAGTATLLAGALWWPTE